MEHVAIASTVHRYPCANRLPAFPAFENNAGYAAIFVGAVVLPLCINRTPRFAPEARGYRPKLYWLNAKQHYVASTGGNA
jgi:hypothetical protein